MTSYNFLIQLKSGISVEHYLYGCFVVLKLRQPSWHAKHRFSGFRWRVGSWRPPEKHQNFTNYHRLLTVAAVIWPKYCRYGVKHYIINQSKVKFGIPATWTISLYLSWFAWDVRSTIVRYCLCVPSHNRLYQRLRLGCRIWLIFGTTESTDLLCNIHLLDETCSFVCQCRLTKFHHLR